MREVYSGRAVKSHIEQGEYIFIWASNSRGHRDGLQSDNKFRRDTEFIR